VEDKESSEEAELENPKAAYYRSPQIPENIPICAGEILILKTLAPLQHQHAIAFLSQTHGRHAAAKSGTDDDEIEGLIVCHVISSSVLESWMINYRSEYTVKNYSLCQSSGLCILDAD
jgi:hypothetical protein